MLTESGFCEEEGVGPTAEGPILQVQQGAGLTEAVSILGSLLSGLSGAALAVEVLLSLILAAREISTSFIDGRYMPKCHASPHCCGSISDSADGDLECSDG